jgi:hypothetical protein
LPKLISALSFVISKKSPKALIQQDRMIVLQRPFSACGMDFEKSQEARTKTHYLPQRHQGAKKKKNRIEVFIQLGVFVTWWLPFSTGSQESQLRNPFLP